jgi:hypothetical protein
MAQNAAMIQKAVGLTGVSPTHGAASANSLPWEPSCASKGPVVVAEGDKLDAVRIHDDLMVGRRGQFFDESDNRQSETRSTEII